MPTNITRADYDQLKQIADRFGRECSQTQQMLQGIQQQVQTLQSEDWVGQGAQAFYAEMNNAVLPSLKRLVQALASAQKTTQAISVTVKETEDEAACILQHRGDTKTGSSKLASPFLGRPPLTDSMSGGGVTQQWWNEMLRDPFWSKVLMDSAKRHNPPGSGLSDRDFAAVMASIILIESGAIGGRSGTDTIKGKIGAWVNSQPDEVRVPMIMGIKATEIIAYEIFGLNSNSLGLMNFNMARLDAIRSDSSIVVHQYYDDANAFCPFPGENVCMAIPSQYVPDFLEKLNRDANQLVRQDQYMEYMAASLEKFILDAKPYIPASTWTSGGVTLPTVVKMFSQFHFAGIAEGIPLFDPINQKAILGGWATPQQMANAKANPDPIEPTWGIDTEQNQKAAQAYADAIAQHFWAAITELDAAGYK